MSGLLWAEGRRTFIEMVRYPVETISEMVTLFLIFAGLFLGAQYLSASPLGGARLSTAVLGYAVWMVMLEATSSMGWSIQNEAQNGTLEQVMLSPWSGLTIFVVRAVMAILLFLVPAAIVISGMTAITGVTFHWSLGALLPSVMAVVTAWGLGLVVAAAGLVLKRVGQVLQIINFLLLFIILAPIAAIPGLVGHVLVTLVPFSADVTWLHASLSGGAVGARWIYTASLLDVLFWGVGGSLAFVGADRLVRRRGTLSHY